MANEPVNVAAERAEDGAVVLVTYRGRDEIARVHLKRGRALALIRDIAGALSWAED